MQNYSSGNVSGWEGDPGPQGKFYLMTTELHLDGRSFYIRSLKWSEWYMYVVYTGNVKGHEGPPGSKGQFKFEQVGNEDVYLISSIQWPDWYIYMQNSPSANVTSYKGDPGPQGHWYVTTTKDGYKQLCTVKWPSWYMYMEDYSSGSVSGWEGDPGPQGKFCLMEVHGGECKIAIEPQLQPE